MEQLTTGRELDALVAEKVMGYSRVDVPRDVNGENEGVTLWPPNVDVAEYQWPYVGPVQIYSFCPMYSTDIAAAWQVVEKMQERGMWAQLRTPFGKGKMDDGFWCGFTPMLTTGWNGRPDHNTSAAMMPLAICLAALKAVGMDYGTSRTETHS